MSKNWHTCILYLWIKSWHPFQAHFKQFTIERSPCVYKWKTISIVSTWFPWWWFRPATLMKYVCYETLTHHCYLFFWWNSVEIGQPKNNESQNNNNDGKKYIHARWMCFLSHYLNDLIVIKKESTSNSTVKTTCYHNCFEGYSAFGWKLRKDLLSKSLDLVH